jgi:rhamnogalacturonyl hydrolase YesR
MQQDRFSFRNVMALLVCAAAVGVTLPVHAQSPAPKPSKSMVDRNAAGDSPADPGPLAADLAVKLDKKDIEAAMRKVADWQLAYSEKKFNQQWTYAALYDGLLAASQATGDPKYRQAVEAFAAKSDWQLIDERFPHADDEALGQAYLDLYKDHPEPVKIAATKAVLDRLVARQDDPKKPLWWWCDALFMAPPVLMRMYTITGDKRYLDTMDREWWITYDALYDPKNDLYHRDATYLTKTEKNGQPLFWARGNGWVLAALAEVLQQMPKDYPTRPKYVAEFAAMSARIAGLQQPDGLWKTGLLDPESYPMAEVSGSAFFTYAMAWGMNHGLLDAKTFRPVVQRSWVGMISHIYASGRLGSIQPVGAAPDAFSPSSSYVFGVGGFLLAGSELDKMASAQKR